MPLSIRGDCETGRREVAAALDLHACGFRGDAYPLYTAQFSFPNDTSAPFQLCVGCGPGKRLSDLRMCWPEPAE